MRYTVEPRRYVKGYGFLSFAGMDFYLLLKILAKT